jgi:ribonuclease J
MNIIIHRGAHEIGGNCIELISGGKSVLLDIGKPLSDDNTDISYVHGKYDAVIISHSHADHYGLMDMLDKNIPIYIGELSFQLIQALSYFTNNPLPENRIILFEPWKDFKIEGTPFTVHPYLMDHSAPEAFAFLISDGEEKIFYTGDFRATGAKKIVLENLEKHPPEGVTKLIIEGTNLSRQAGPYKTEDDIKHAFQHIFEKQTNISFVLGSSQNIDRIICAYKAARDSKKTLVMDFYTYWVLTLVSQKSTAIKAVLPDIKVLRKGSISGGQYSKMMKHKSVFGPAIYRAKSKTNLMEPMRSIS